ncbi:SLBB domain-containing protein [Oscillatoriales cyanobacterium LEGE 11467]|uniref:SLBB domain-containing protein n=1 Tax=Zarconia navalis LEGE 11467 TaxID=1828826 RepID=A0A928Z891_9CYAN|nr:polysaccharide biosynthesis/export family protein [Zarconia navalis]MBE9039596.1 SLBB domain-containing protein [Zarconia navalis LEGE 11467]
MSSLIFLQSFASLTLLTQSHWVTQLPSVPLPPPPLPGSGNKPAPSTLNRAVSPSPAEASYILGAGDRLRVDVFGVPQYSGEYLVLLDGTINLQVIGRLFVSGLTLPQAQDLISGRYAPFLRRPLVALVLLEPRPVQIAVSGEVNRPGSYTLTTQAGRLFPTLTEALSVAGGVTQAAGVRQVQIQRGERTLVANLLDLTQNGAVDQDPILLDGDSIWIPTAESFDARRSRAIESATFSPLAGEPIQIAVVGEVFRPGPHTVSPEGGIEVPPTVTQAIEVAGGITDLADIRRIEVRRLTREGAQTIEVNLWELLQSGDIAQDIILQTGDTIAIPTAREIDPTEIEALASASFSPDTIQVNVVGEVVRPGPVDVPPNTPLNQALLVAGGFDPIRASDSAVELIRLNPDGTVSRREIAIDFEQGIDTIGNPLLQNNDVIVVGRSGLTSVADTVGEVLRPVGSFFSFLGFFRIFQGGR